MVKAILSDIHANFEALTAVLDALGRQGVAPSAILCLGDIIGYGASPRECLRACQDFRLNLLGNHEEGVLFYPDDLSPPARRAAEWTRGELNSPRHPRAETEALWDFLGDLEPHRESGDTLFVHASPRHFTRDYVFPSDAQDVEKRTAIFAGIRRWGFHGHTHVPGVMLETGEYLRPEESGHRFTLGEHKAFIDVGSVGQPRDGDPRASFVTVDGPEVTFHRVPYDVDAAMTRIKTSRLPAGLADRLKQGK